MRVEDPRVTFPAAVLTWLDDVLGERLAEEDLARLRSLEPEDIAALQLTRGRPPLYLREARLPSSLALLGPSRLPVLAQTDANAPGFGPWAVLIAIDEETVTLDDPRNGRLRGLPRTSLEDHLAGLVAVFQDPDGLVGLEPGTMGPSVEALQRRLRNAGVYLIEPTASFDPFTEAAVQKYREQQELPGSSTIDPLLALMLMEE